MMHPKHLKKWLFLVGILYLVFPRDLIPDYIGRGFGLIDDVALMGMLSYFLRKYARNYVAQQAEGEGGQAQSERRDDPQRGPFGQQRASGPAPDAASADRDPHLVLAVRPGANQDEIRAAYRERMHEYHPDKVAHLGEDLQQLAHRKSLEIQRAYQRLKR